MVMTTQHLEDYGLFFKKNFKSSFTLGWSVQLGLFDGGNIDKNEGTIMILEGKFYSVTEDNLDSSSLESCWPLLVAYLGGYCKKLLLL